MSDLKLFRIEAGIATEVLGATMALEKPLQQLMEANMETIFGVRFVASEHSTGPKHGGRIDSLGLDENNSPVIFEYKRATNQNVINQGLFYLDWLLDHRAEFQLLVMKRLGETAETIDWSNPRLICVAADFTRYDEHAVLQINRSIELVRYRDYGGQHLILELITSTAAKATAAGAPGPGTPPAHGLVALTPAPSKSGSGKTVSELHTRAPQHVKDLFDALEAYLLGLGEDVSKKTTSFYYAYRRLKNFACIEVHPQTQTILVYVKVSPDHVQLEPGFTRDVRKIGHFSPGDLEIALTTPEALERAKPLMTASYEAN